MPARSPGGAVLDRDHPVSMQDVAVGDLFFLEPDAEPVSKEVVVLDRGPFAHVGIVAGPDRLVSARVGRGPRPTDLGGGVKVNTAADFPGRQIWIARCAPSFPGRLDPAQAVERALEHTDRAGADGDRTDFSLVKLVLVAFGLRAFDPTWSAGLGLRPEVFAAARAWSAPMSDAGPTPGTGATECFYCAEFVAHVYGVQFTMDDFPPDRPGPDPGVAPFEVMEAAGPAWAQQVVTGATLGLKMWEADRDFVVHCRHDFFELLRQRLPHPIAALVRDWHRIVDVVHGALSDEPPEGADGGAAEPEPAAVEVVTGSSPLPPALVTPRMLLDAPWIEWCRPLRPAAG